MHVHAYKIREFFSCKEFNLITVVNSSVHLIKCICFYQLFQCWERHFRYRRLCIYFPVRGSVAWHPEGRLRRRLVYLRRPLLCCNDTFSTQFTKVKTFNYGIKNVNKVYYGKTHKLTFTLPRRFLVTRVLLKWPVDYRQKFFEFLHHNNLIFRDCAIHRERLVASIVALLFLILSIRKAHRLRFLALYLVFERRQCDLTNALLTTRIKRLKERRRRKGTLARRRRVAWVYPRPQGCFRYGKTTLEFLRRHLIFEWTDSCLLLQEIIVVLQKNKMKIT